MKFASILLILTLSVFLSSCGKKEDVTNIKPKKELVINMYESKDDSDEVKDFTTTSIYDYCYDSGGPSHLIIRGDYKDLLLYVNTEKNDKEQLINDKNPISVNVVGSATVDLSDKISGPMSGKIVLMQSNNVLFEKEFTSHGCK
jgi:hypothetical protein